MKRTAILLSMGLLTALPTVPSANAQTGAPAISQVEASAIAVDAYFWPWREPGRTMARASTPAARSARAIRVDCE